MCVFVYTCIHMYISTKRVIIMDYLFVSKLVKFANQNICGLGEEEYAIFRNISIRSSNCIRSFHE